jgi:hypothetical protein
MRPTRDPRRRPDRLEPLSRLLAVRTPVSRPRSRTFPRRNFSCPVRKHARAASNIFDIYFRNTSARFLHAEARIRSGEGPMEEALKHELESRRQRVLAAARAQGAEAVLVFATDGRGYNLRYLTNFAPIFGDAFLVLTPVRTVYFLNFNWEIPRARQASDVAEFIATFDLVGDVTRILRELDVGDTIATVGFDRIPHPFY